MAIGAASVYSIASDTYFFQIVIIAAIFFIFGIMCAAVWLGFGSVLRRWLANPAILRCFNFGMAGLLVASLVPMFADYLP